jgi:hypothetical protein
MSDSTLDYYRPQDPKPPAPESGVFAVGSLLCIGVPVLGAAIRNGPLFLVGGLFSAIVGVLLGLSGLLRAMRSSTGLITFCSMALAANLLVGTYFLWLFFVRGLC